VRRSFERGMTLIEVLIAVSLVALLATGMLFAMRAAVAALESAGRNIESLRRASGAQRILEQQLAGFMPVMAACGASPHEQGGPRVMYFQGLPGVARFATSYSIEGGARGRPQLVELFTAPRPGGGVRLLVNEIPYTGPVGAGFLCRQPAPDPLTRGFTPMFPPPQPGPRSFVLADRLAWCRISYLEDDGVSPQRWLTEWTRLDLWPAAIRVEMAPLDAASRTALPAIIGRIRPNRLPGEYYEP